MIESPNATRIKADLQGRVYPKLPRKQRRAVRRIFWYGLLHPDAMHWAIWGANEERVDELAAEDLKAGR